MNSALQRLTNADQWRKANTIGKVPGSASRIQQRNAWILAVHLAGDGPLRGLGGQGILLEDGWPLDGPPNCAAKAVSCHMGIFSIVDDKHVPLYRVIWVAAVPHFCGEEDCVCEGQYEIRLEQGESVWATTAERDAMLSALEHWGGGADPSDHLDGDWDQP